MKASVILGVSHMLLGICIKGANAVYFKRELDLYHEFIPQLLLLTCMFGYMDLLIVVKWLTNWEGREAQAPSIVGTMIQLFLQFGEPKSPTDLSIIEDQAYWSKLLLVVIFITPPWMLLAKPLKLKAEHERLMKEKEAQGGDYEM